VLRRLTTSTRARLIALKLALIALLAITVTQVAAVTHVDAAALREIQEWTSAWLTDLVYAITELGGTQIALALTVSSIALLALTHHWRGAIALGLSVGLTQVVVSMVKVLVARPRPDEDLSAADPSGFSFPSAHSATAVATYVMLAVLASRVLPARWRVPTYLAAAAVVLLIGLSRVYLGAHYPTDVIAGWMTGGVLVLASWTLAHRLPRRGPGLSPA
jgi:undecaprenyl-diphosphatase